MICFADEIAFGPNSTASFVNPTCTSSSVGPGPGPSSEAYRCERSWPSDVDAHEDTDAAALTDATTSSHASRCIIILHGDLSAPGKPITGPLYVRPILEPHPWAQDNEIVPPDEFLVDLIHRAFHRMFEGDGDHPPMAPSVRVVNLSIGDPARMFIRRLSPLAKLIDWLSHKYNLVVIVSAGNHRLDAPISPDDLKDAERQRTSAARVHHSLLRQHRLLSPAEAVNVVTVGAQQTDNLDGPLPDTVVDLFDRDGPASYSATGFGFRRSVKPEVLLPGGREVYVRPPTLDGEFVLEPARAETTGPGIRVAAPGLAGSLDGSVYTCGSSNAAALATRTIRQHVAGCAGMDRAAGVERGMVEELLADGPVQEARHDPDELVETPRPWPGSRREELVENPGGQPADRGDLPVGSERARSRSVTCSLRYLRPNAR